MFWQVRHTLGLKQKYLNNEKLQLICEFLQQYKSTWLTL